MKIITAVALIIMLTGCYGKKGPIKTGLEGKPLPSFKLLLSDSLTLFNSDDIPKGKPIVLFYFSPVCPHCRAQMKDILEKMTYLKNIQFIACTPFSFQEMKAFYNKYKINRYSNITMVVDRNNLLLKYFKIEKVPYLAIYDKHKQLIEAFVGRVDVKQILEVTQT